MNRQESIIKDFLQLMTYTYIINNYLSEIQSDDTKIPEYAGLKPQLQKYETKQIQFIYLAHDIISSNETESLSAARKRIEELKKQIKSKNNPFFFITTFFMLISHLRQNALLQKK